MQGRTEWYFLGVGRYTANAALQGESGWQCSTSGSKLRRWTETEYPIMCSHDVLGVLCQELKTGDLELFHAYNRYGTYL